MTFFINMQLQYYYYAVTLYEHFDVDIYSPGHNTHSMRDVHQDVFWPSEAAHSAPYVNICQSTLE